MSTAKKAVTLERSPLAKTVAFTKDTLDLAKRAAIVLRYRALAERVFTPKTLAQVLIELNIQPFTAATVDRYKLSKNVPGMQWRMVSLETFPFLIPIHVLNKAIQIKEADPLIQLNVDYLAVQQRVDPFLVAVKGNETYYVEVWDEASFESALY